VISIGLFHDLNPLDTDLVFVTFVLSFISWQISTLAKTVETGTPIDEELKLLFNLIPTTPKNILSEFF